MSQVVRDYVDKAALGERGSCHLFRHTMATLMLEGGADIRFIHIATPEELLSALAAEAEEDHDDHETLAESIGED